MKRKQMAAKWHVCHHCRRAACAKSAGWLFVPALLFAARAVAARLCLAHHHTSAYFGIVKRRVPHARGTSDILQHRDKAPPAASMIPARYRTPA